MDPRDGFWKGFFRRIFYAAVDHFPAPRAAGIPGRPETWQRILVVQLDMLGDMLMTTPFLEALRSHFPTAVIALICTPSGSLALKNSAFVDEIFCYQTFWEDSTGTFFPTLRHFISTSRLFKWLKSRRFDACFILNHREQPLVPWIASFSKAPVRIGFFQGKGDRFLTVGVLPDPRRHYILDNLEILRETDVKNKKIDTQMKFHVSPKTTDFATQWLAEWCKGPLVCITPATVQNQKKWSRRAWIALSDFLLGKGYCLLYSGDPSDKNEIEAIRRKLRQPDLTRNVAGLFDLEKFAALVKMSKLLITLDSAPMHLADSLGTPVAVFFSDYYNPDKLLPLHSKSLVVRSDTSVRKKDLGYQSKYMAFDIPKTLIKLERFLDSLQGESF